MPTRQSGALGIDAVCLLIGLLTRREAEPYPGWDPDLETFSGANYVAHTQEMTRGLPMVIWWKDRQTTNGRRPNAGVGHS